MISGFLRSLNGVWQRQISAVNLTWLYVSFSLTGFDAYIVAQPERIKGESVGSVSSYTVSSDVWSLGLSIIEFAIGHYPYPPETYSNVFAQLQAIVHGDPPGLPSTYSAVADDFVRKCLHKDAHRRPSYAQLMVSLHSNTSYQCLTFCAGTFIPSSR